MAMKISYQEAMENLQTMFSEIDRQVIHNILVTHQGKLDPTIEDLLKLTNDTVENENIFDEPSNNRPNDSNFGAYGNSDELAKQKQEKEDMELAFKLQQQFISEGQSLQQGHPQMQQYQMQGPNGMQPRYQQGYMQQQPPYMQGYGRPQVQYVVVQPVYQQPYQYYQQPYQYQQQPIQYQQRPIQYQQQPIQYQQRPIQYQQQPTYQNQQQYQSQQSNYTSQQQKPKPQTDSNESAEDKKSKKNTSVTTKKDAKAKFFSLFKRGKKKGKEGTGNNDAGGYAEIDNLDDLEIINFNAEGEGGKLEIYDDIDQIPELQQNPYASKPIDSKNTTKIRRDSDEVLDDLNERARDEEAKANFKLAQQPNYKKPLFDNAKQNNNKSDSYPLFGEGLEDVDLDDFSDNKRAKVKDQSLL